MNQKKHLVSPLGALLALTIAAAALIAGAGMPRQAIAAGEGTFSFTGSPYSVTEGGTAVITIGRTGGTVPASVTVAFTGGNAGDYSTSLAYFNFGASDTSVSVNFPTNQNGIVDGSRIVTLTMAIVTGGVISGTNPTQLTINDDDSAGVTVSPTSGLVTTENGGTATFTVRLNTLPSAAVTIGLTSSDTTEGTVSPSSLTFTTGNWATPQTVTVTGVDDVIVDGSVAYTIVTAAASGGDYTGVTVPDVAVTNTDNDGTGTLQFTSTTFSVSESVGTASVGVSRTSGTSGAASVQCNTVAGGSAIVGTDYTAVTGQVLNWSPGEGGTKNCSIPILNDLTAESSETVNLTLTNASGAAPGSPTTATLTIVDDDTVGVPVVTSVSPAFGPVTGLNGVVITGVNLSSALSITFGGISYPATITNNTSTSITVNAPAHPAGLVDVLVTTALGTSAPNVSAVFAYGGVTGLPVINSVTPASGPTAGSTYFTLTGTNFIGVGSITFGGTPVTLFTVVNNTSITGYTPAHAAGLVQVRATNATGTSLDNGTADDFTYGGVTGLPVVSAVNPAFGPTAGLTYFTLSGTNFTGVNLVGSITFGGTPVSNFSVVNDSTITGYTPAHAAGLVQVRVTNAIGTSVDNGTADDFTYTGTSPVVSSVSPTSGPVGGGTTVVIAGSGFTGATSVSFGTTATSSFTVNSDVQITVTSPAHSAGTVSVFVTVGAVSSPEAGTADNFTYTSTGEHYTYALSFRWNLIVWLGADGASVESALKGLETPDEAATNNVFTIVTGVFSWSASGQSWRAFYPSGVGIPGANDFTTLARFGAYWLAVSTGTNWTIATP